MTYETALSRYGYAKKPRRPRTTPRCAWCSNSAGKIHGELIPYPPENPKVMVHAENCYYRMKERKK
jgi:hypothetical protein